MKEKIDKFCKNYEVSILNTSKRRQRYKTTQFFTNPMRADIIQDNVISYESEPIYTVDIPESRFKTLVEMEQRFMNHRNDGWQLDWFETLMNKEREEAHYRHTNEAVKKAYEQYSLMLHLAGYDKKL